MREATPLPPVETGILPSGHPYARIGVGERVVLSIPALAIQTIEVLREELDIALALLGVPSVDAIDEFKGRYRCITADLRNATTVLPSGERLTRLLQSARRSASRRASAWTPRSSPT